MVISNHENSLCSAREPHCEQRQAPDAIMIAKNQMISQSPQVKTVKIK
jgi:hypothetical protein